MNIDDKKIEWYWYKAGEEQPIRLNCWGAKTLRGAQRIARKYDQTGDIVILEKTSRYAGLNCWKPIKKTYWQSSFLMELDKRKCKWGRWEINEDIK